MILTVFANAAMVDHVVEEVASVQHQPIQHSLAQVAMEMATESFIQASKWRMKLYQTQVRLLDMLEYIQDQRV